MQRRYSSLEEFLADNVNHIKGYFYLVVGKEIKDYKGDILEKEPDKYYMCTKEQ